MYYINPIRNNITTTMRDMDIVINEIKDNINKRFNRIEKILKRERWVKNYGYTKRDRYR